MHLNRAQRIVLIIGLFGVGVTGLYPPWAVTCWSVELGADRTIVYSLLFAPPNTVNELGYGACQTHLDGIILVATWITALAIISGLILLLGLQRDPLVQSST